MQAAEKSIENNGVETRDHAANANVNRLKGFDLNKDAGVAKRDWHGYKIPKGYFLAPNGEDIIPDGTTLVDDGYIDANGDWYRHRDEMFVWSLTKQIKLHIERTVGDVRPQPERWTTVVHGFEYSSEKLAEDFGLAVSELANKYAAASLNKIGLCLLEKRNAFAKLTSKEVEFAERVSAAHTERSAIEKKRDQHTSVMNGYARAIKTESMPEDWVWMPNKSQSGVAYFNLNSPFTAYQAKVMDARIPVQLWEDRTDSNGRPVYGRGGAVEKVKPSESHLSRQAYEIQKLTMDPAKPRLYTDAQGDRCLNHWRDIQFPARPEEKYFKSVEVVKNWLEFIYPGRAEWILDYWAHAYQKMTEKPSTAMVLGGGQGIGKDTLLTIANWTFSQQGKVATIITSQLEQQFNEFLFFPVVIVNELDIKRSDHKSFNKLKRDLKTYTGGLPSYLPVNPKGLALQQVANIHRFYFTTNYEDEFPRDPDDRRYMVLRSHADHFQVAERRDQWFADCPMEDGSKFDILKWLAQGYGDAFTCYLLDRDISKFDPFNLPLDLMKDYDELKKGIDIEPVIAAALNEIALGYGAWLYEEGGGTLGWPSDEADVSTEHWPEFVTSQQLLCARASFDPEMEGEQLRKSKDHRGHVEVLMRTAGYVRVPRPEGRTQWVGAKPRKEDRGVTRVQSSTVYIRRDRIIHGESVPERQERAKAFIASLTDFMRTEAGKESVWDQAKWEAQM